MAKLVDLKTLWEEKKIVDWINAKYELGIYTSETTKDNELFLDDMSVWNTVWTHEDETSKHYKGWEPYCCSDKPCRSSALDRMKRRELGWYCPFCNTFIGKHLLRARNEKITLGDFSKELGRPVIIKKGS